jgi:Fe-S-cluster formation regulator IscX/YfhJ
MGIATQLDGIRKLLGGAPRQEEEERLLQLYWNRVELKKEFSRLQEDNYGLLQQLKKNEAAQVQLQNRLKQLEEFLGDPENGATALVYYQLQAVWSLAAKRMAELAQELAGQQQERERRLQLIEFNQNRQRRLAELEAALLDAQSQADSLEARLHLLRKKLDGLRQLWHYFKRRDVNATVDPLQVDFTRARAEVLALQEQRDQLTAAPEPEFVGLSVEGKRLVNTAALAYAQQLVERLSEDSLALLAKEASVRRVHDVRYGAPTECQHLMVVLQTAVQQLQNNARDLQGLKTNTLRVRANATYRSDHDTVPSPESIGTITIRAVGQTIAQPIGQAQAAEYEEVNVLLDNYWELYAALLH